MSDSNMLKKDELTPKEVTDAETENKENSVSVQELIYFALF